MEKLQEAAWRLGKNVTEVGFTICTPRNQLQPLILEKPIEVAKLIIKPRRKKKERGIQCGSWKERPQVWEGRSKIK